MTPNLCAKGNLSKQFLLKVCMVMPLTAAIISYPKLVYAQSQPTNNVPSNPPTTATPKQVEQINPSQTQNAQSPNNPSSNSVDTNSNPASDTPTNTYSVDTLPVAEPAKSNSQNLQRGHFNLAVLQSRPLLSRVVMRISLKSKGDNGYLGERFIGDFLYTINQRATFVRGSKPGDRVVVRLIDLQNRLIGYSEFELLEENASVSLILPNLPSNYGQLRTVFGIDKDRNGEIDRARGSSAYSYFTQVSLDPGQSLSKATVRFLPDTTDIQPNQFNMADLPAQLRNPSYVKYPSSFTTGSFALTNRKVDVFTKELPSTVIAMPGKLAPFLNVNSKRAQTIDVNRQMQIYGELKLDPSQGNTVFQQ
ncbi:MAG: hypothetical protein HC856_05140 [Pseudanabaena sp. RU_4_16]|nr:hypothetical protein [Pseudanabaena sp. RU_4_16]